MEDQFKTPVIFIIFNRPDHTAKVFQVIRQVKPSVLFVIADGPRNETDNKNCEATRAILESVDWECKVFRNYSDINLGCKSRVSSGIDWAFSQVEEGIILEDDCVPDSTFFTYCENMLERYRHDRRIMMIAGTNYLNCEDCSVWPYSYFFSNYYPIWGWATWRRAWAMYDVNMNDWPDINTPDNLRWLFPYKEISDHYTYMFNLIKNGFDTWDIQWWFACIFQHGLSIIPITNLVSNIGLIGTHSNTQNSFAIDMPVVPFSSNTLLHPEQVYANYDLNKKLYQQSHARLKFDSNQVHSESTSLLMKKNIQKQTNTLIKRMRRNIKRFITNPL